MELPALLSRRFFEEYVLCRQIAGEHRLLLMLRRIQHILADLTQELAELA